MGGNYMPEWLNDANGSVLGVATGVGLATVVSGFLLALWYCWARRSIAVAAACLQEACSLLLKRPTLIFLLPLLHLGLLAVVTLATGYGALLLLSTADVQASTVTVLGNEVLGIHRSFRLTWELVAGLMCWAFAMLWYQEIVNALHSFVISFTAAQSYFAEGDSEGGRVSRLPVLTGTCVALTWHLGSVVLGAFILATLRSIWWVLAALYRLAGSGNKENRCVRWILLGLDCLVQLATEVMKRVNGNAFTDLALTSSPFCTAAGNASSIMLRHSSVVWLRYFCLEPMLFFGGVCYSATIGVGSYFLFTYRPQMLFSSLPAEFRAECEELDNAFAVACIAALMCFVAVRIFTAGMNKTTDAVLYCFLWDIQDGKIDAERTPQAFKAFVGQLCNDMEAPGCFAGSDAWIASIMTI